MLLRSFCVVLFAGVASHAALRILTVNMGTGAFQGTFQKGSPIAVLGHHSGDRDLLNGISIVNISDAKIVRIQFGWLLGEKGRPGGVPFKGFPSEVDLAPWATTTVGRQGAFFSDIHQLALRNHLEEAELTVGVTYVRSADGREWSYDHAAAGRFDFVPDRDLEIRIQPALKALQEYKNRSGAPSPPSRAGRPTGL